MFKMIQLCIVCNNECKITKNNDIMKFDCKYCGKYNINENVKKLITGAKNINFISQNFDRKLLEKIKNNFYKLQFYIREQNDEFNETPYLTEEKIKTIINLPDKSIKEQFDLFLLNLYKNNFNDDLGILRIKSWIMNSEILRKIAQKAEEKKFIKVQFTIGRSFIFSEKLTFDGIEYVEENVLQPNQNSKKIFLAFKFDDELNNIFKNDISDMLKSLDFNPVIVNQNTSSHDEKISDKRSIGKNTKPF
jgi:hypothetical protein